MKPKLPVKKAYKFLVAESRPNQKGDLFTKLIRDFFYSLGWDDLRLNINKAGREVDIQARHRAEPRRLIAECKAWGKPVGGDEINKFVGVLDAERSGAKEVSGYFVSLSGFTQAAIEQEGEIEKKKGAPRIALYDGSRVIEEMIRSRMLVSDEQAVGHVIHYLGDERGSVSVDSVKILLLTDMGLVWVIYFMRGGVRTYFSLVHADGDVIPEARVGPFLDARIDAGLKYIGPSASPDELAVAEAKTRYLAYLAAEFGEIHTLGIPADQQLGSKHLRLESLFVPLHLELLKSRNSGDSPNEGSIGDSPSREPVGRVLRVNPRVAILGPPGSGKTTLLQRIALAYGFPDRRNLIDDELPNRVLMPIFIRCRDLGEAARAPFLDILGVIAKRAEMDDFADVFSVVLRDSLRSGHALILVDGLDEIAEGGHRLAFVRQLRVFLAIYPAINIVITSREAGFRVIGDALAVHCGHYRMADFDSKDVERLCRAWYREVVGDRPTVLEDAEGLARTIIESDRLFRLAKNPLLLTTLLLVKRWVGQLPTRRTVLYGKAIEVLLMTWNTEAHEPLDQEESIPQLAFVAFAMMKEGVQRISLRRLRDLLSLARKQMSDVLLFARASVNEFIERVELRSSILMLSGYIVEDGRLQPAYEFRHLTFQEYLAALAIVDGYYPDRRETDTLLTLLVPYLGKPAWREVIPLAAVLAGRSVQPLLEHLCHQVAGNRNVAIALMGQCILDEVPMPPHLLRTMLAMINRYGSDPSLFQRLGQSRVKEEWENVRARSPV